MAAASLIWISLCLPESLLAQAMRLPRGQLHKPSPPFSANPSGCSSPDRLKGSPQGCVRSRSRCSLGEEHLGFITQSFAFAPIPSTNHDEGKKQDQILEGASWLHMEAGVGCLRAGLSPCPCPDLWQGTDEESPSPFAFLSLSKTIIGVHLQIWRSRHRPSL